MERRPPPRPRPRALIRRRLPGALAGGALLLTPAALGAAVLTAHSAAAAPPDVVAAPRHAASAPRHLALAAGGYDPKGTRITGGRTPAKATPISTGPYLDTIGPGETRWYAVTLDAVSTADLSVTGLPRPGAAVDYSDGLELELITTGQFGYTCDSRSAHFGQDEGAMNLTDAVSRIPSHGHTEPCDKAGRYLLSVHRTSAAGSDRASWPVELTYAVEAPLPAGTVPAAAQSDYGPAPAPATGTPRNITGGAGFGDAPAVATGVWRDRLLPAQTRYYKVHVGWGQQLTYAAEFANVPARDDSGADVTTFVTTSAFAPDRLPVEDASDARDSRSYDGSPVSVGLGTVPVAWTNRWVSGDPAHDVHAPGAYWIAVGLGPDAAKLVKNTAVGVVLRVEVTGNELAGPQYHAPALHGRTADSGPPTNPGPDSDPAPGPVHVRTAADGSAAGSGRGGIGRITGMDMIAAGTGGAVAFAGVATTALVHRARNRRTRGGA